MRSSRSCTGRCPARCCQRARCMAARASGVPVARRGPSSSRRSNQWVCVGYCASAIKSSSLHANNGERSTTTNTKKTNNTNNKKKKNNKTKNTTQNNKKPQKTQKKKKPTTHSACP